MMKWASANAFCAVGVLAGVMLTGCGGGGGGGGGGGIPLALPAAATSGNSGSAAQGSGTGSGAGSTGSTGGTNSGTSVDVAFSPAIAQIVLAAGDGSMPAPGIQKLTATLTGAKVAGLYVFITNADVLFPARQLLGDNGNGSYTNGFPIYFNRVLAAGTRKGSLQLQVCADLACSTEYGANGGALPYEITVLPAPTISLSVNGIPLTSSTQPVTLKDGDTVDLHSDLPVTWSTGSSGVKISGENYTATDWHAVLGYGMSGHGLTGTMNVNAITIPDPANPEKPQANTRVSFTLTE